MRTIVDVSTCASVVEQWRTGKEVDYEAFKRQLQGTVQLGPAHSKEWNRYLIIVIDASTLFSRLAEIILTSENLTVR